MVELLASALVGTHLAVDHPPGHPFDEINRGAFVIAIDPGTFASIGANDADRLFRLVLPTSVIFIVPRASSPTCALLQRTPCSVTFTKEQLTPVHALTRTIVVLTSTSATTSP
jgi:hypothetical protein